MPLPVELLALMLPLAGAAGEDPVLPLIRTGLSRCVSEAAARVCDLPPFSQANKRHVRLVSACEGDFTLNGQRLSRDGSGFDLTGELSNQSSNRLELPPACKEAWLHETPRFFIQEVRRHDQTGKLLILIRNTLENTTSFVLTAYGAKDVPCGEKAGTVPANATTEVELPCPAPIVSLELWKAPEAIEGSYRFRLPIAEPGNMRIRTGKP